MISDAELELLSSGLEQYRGFPVVGVGHSELEALIARLGHSKADAANWKQTAISRGEKLEHAEQQVARVRAMAEVLLYPGDYPSERDKAEDRVGRSILRALDGESNE